MFNSVDFFIFKKCWGFYLHLFSINQRWSLFKKKKKKWDTLCSCLKKILKLSPFAVHLAWCEHWKSHGLCSVKNQTKKAVVDEWCLYRWKHAHYARRGFLQQVLQDCTSWKFTSFGYTSASNSAIQESWLVMANLLMGPYESKNTVITE